MATQYSHTQYSRWTALVGMPFAALLLAAVIFVDPLPWTARAAFFGGALLLAATLYNFSRLTVKVTDEITVFFGRRWPRRIIDPATVTATRPVRHKPWYGWGMWWIPRGWLWNVWGLSAVELSLASGRRFWIGTDEPEALRAAIRSVTGMAIG